MGIVLQIYFLCILFLTYIIYLSHHKMQYSKHGHNE